MCEREHLKEIDIWGLRWGVWGRVVVLEGVGVVRERVPGEPERERETEFSYLWLISAGNYHFICL